MPSPNPAVQEKLEELDLCILTDMTTVGDSVTEEEVAP